MSMICRVALCLVPFVVTLSFAHAEQSVVRYDDGEGGQMWYRLYLPDSFDPKKSYPLTTFLHGSDGSNIKPVVNPDRDVERAPAGLVEALTSGPYESILIAPQLERGNWQVMDNDRLIKEAIESVQQTYGSDTSRRYMTGLSFGGFGTFHMLREFPNYFAAGVPIAGFYSPPFEPDEPFPDDPYSDYAQDVGNTPLWAFHGTADGVVPVEATRAVTDALFAAEANVRYSEMPSEGHPIWDQIYDVDRFPATVVYSLDVDTAGKTFQLWVSAETQKTRGLGIVHVDLVGADTVTNVLPKMDFSSATGTSLGFTEQRSGADEFPIYGRQKFRSDDENNIEGLGQFSGTLPGAGAGTGEVQATYEAPLLVAQGTFTDLDTLDFSSEFVRRNVSAVNALMIPQEPGGEYDYAVSYTQLYHDGQLVKSRGSHGELYPWLFSQQLVPEPNSLVAVVWLVLLGISRTGRELSDSRNEDASG